MWFRAYGQFVVALLALILSATAPAYGAGERKEAYTLGVFPHLPPRELEKVYAPIAAALGEALGRTVHFRSSSTYANFRDKLAEKQYEIVFVQPFDYVRLADEHGYSPLATRGEPLTAILVVKPDSTVKGEQDLRGKTVALPPKIAAVSHLVENHFRRAGLEPQKDVKLQYFRSHVSCMQQVVIGNAAACGTAAPALRFYQHRMNRKLNVIGETSPIPHTLFAVHPTVPEQERAVLLETILGWANTAEGRELLKRGRLKPFKAIPDRDYDVVREMLK